MVSAPIDDKYVVVMFKIRVEPRVGFLSKVFL